MELLTLATQCETRNPSPHLSLATIYQQINNTKLAETHCNIALELAPTESYVYYKVAMFYEKIG